MIFKTKKLERSLVFLNETRDGILSYSKINHPNEMILILKGHSKKGKMLVESLVVPPFDETGPTFAGFPSNQLPFDADYIGMVHSHPSGSAEPSLEDLDNFFGLVSVIVKSPYENDDIFAWDSSGNSIPILDE
tara:strand:+ start:3719 stop:4117 length:399 start_codon:yes stop_codon:yes gene_type:complete